jgi:hypothetical protein
VGRLVGDVEWVGLPDGGCVGSGSVGIIDNDGVPVASTLGRTDGTLEGLVLRGLDETTEGRVAGAPLGGIDGRFVEKAGTALVGLCVGSVDGTSLGIPDGRLGVKVGAPDGPLVGKAEGIADGLRVTRGTKLGAIDNTEGKPLMNTVGVVVGNLEGSLLGIPEVVLGADDGTRSDIADV